MNRLLLMLILLSSPLIGMEIEKKYLEQDDAFYQKVEKRFTEECNRSENKEEFLQNKDMHYQEACDWVRQEEKKNGLYYRIPITFISDDEEEQPIVELSKLKPKHKNPITIEKGDSTKLVYEDEDDLIDLISGTAVLRIIDDIFPPAKEISLDNPRESKVTQKKIIKKPWITFPHACFSPGIKDLILKLIADEEDGIRCAFFRFTLFDVALKLVEQKKLMEQKKLSSNPLNAPSFILEVIVDPDYNSDFVSALRHLVKNKGNVLACTKPDQSRYLKKFQTMHHKFIIFDNNYWAAGPVVLTGSFNVTAQAEEGSWENVVVFDSNDPAYNKIVCQYSNEFNKLRNLSTPITEKDIQFGKGKNPADIKDKSDFLLKLNGIPVQEWPEHQPGKKNNN